MVATVVGERVRSTHLCKPNINFLVPVSPLPMCCRPQVLVLRERNQHPELISIYLNREGRQFI